MVARYPFRLACAGLLLVGLASGCGGTARIADVWRDPTYTAGPLKKIYVIALRRDSLRRRLWEDAYVADLTSRGVEAMQSYRAFPDAPPDTQQVIATVQQGGYDGVLGNVRLETETEETIVPGATRTEPFTVYNPWSGFYDTYYREVQTPDYVETTELRRFETSVWTTKEDARMVWTSVASLTEAADGKKIESLVKEQILPELEKAGIIPPRRP